MWVAEGIFIFSRSILWAAGDLQCVLRFLGYLHSHLTRFTLVSDVLNFSFCPTLSPQEYARGAFAEGLEGRTWSFPSKRSSGYAGGEAENHILTQNRLTASEVSSIWMNRPAHVLDPGCTGPNDVLERAAAVN